MEGRCPPQPFLINRFHSSDLWIAAWRERDEKVAENAEKLVGMECIIIAVSQLETLMPRRLSPQKEWEQALIDAYYDYRWRQVLQPLHDDFQSWAAGKSGHADLDRAIH